ncbi:hypothetical protein BDV96DRAFT_502059 [Lophiotrema nucula]|uniref:Uncharacterized protein n=1 Tax=Lophiotrema nucula TaxID=690887 RepID=A0A6A5YRT3_9PLEO|nr:hypothetical protein BDV96DRAFT_502059 [Lophiotrema nucula]
MSSAAVPTPSQPYVNGNGFVPPEIRETQFFEKLLQIRDEVLAGKHPRIHLPPNVLEQVAPRPTQHTPPVPSKLVNGTVNGVNASQSFPPRPDSSLQHTASNDHSTPPQTAQRPFTAKSTSSGIDPVLLTKSDHLIRAELNLKRQQVERTLKDQYDKKGRDKDATVDESRFDVEDILSKAQESAKPLSGLPPAASHSEGSESFDENSYYSSKANSWSSEDAENANGTDTAQSLNLQAKRLEPLAGAPKPPTRFPPPAPEQADTAVIDLEEEYEPVDDIEIYEPEPARVPEDAEESDYSPPPADVGPSGPSRGRGRQRGFENNSGTNGSSRRQSPAGQAPPIQNPRKRRREEKRRQQANKRVVRSPVPYIKEEPQSPPPFASYPDTQPSKRRALQPLSSDVDTVPAREGRQQPLYHRDQEHAPRAYRQYDEPLSPTVVRVPQRRDDQDLRRVASHQYARRQLSPAAEIYSPSEVRHIRAASHAFVDRPTQPVYREASARPSAAPRYVQERSPVHEYLPHAQSPVSMAPPPRRIVVDQYGNKYYAAPVDARESMAPPGRRIETDPFYERAVTREPTMRAPARQELYEEEDVQRMMPPPPRRFVETSDAEPLEIRAYRQPSHRPVEVEYAPRELLERRPVYDELALPREYIPSRAYSVRPEAVRRDGSEYVPAPVRYESVQPGQLRAAAPRYREVSVIQEPYDDRRYAYATPSQPRRFIDDGAPGGPEVAQEQYAGEPRRVSYRY